MTLLGTYLCFCRRTGFPDAEKKTEIRRIEVCAVKLILTVIYVSIDCGQNFEADF